MSITLDTMQESVTLAADTITIGRASDNQIVIDDKNVAPYHAELRLGKRGYALVDLGKKGGTYVNERRLEKQTPCRLSNDDTIRIGDTTYTYRATWTLQPSSTTPLNTSPSTVPVVTGRMKPRAIFGIYGGIVLLAIVICATSGIIAFNALPSPSRTLTAYCTALKSRDYGTAYKQLDTMTQKTFNVIAFTQYSEDNEGAGLVKDCSVTDIAATNASASGIIHYTYINKKSHSVHYTLAYNGNTWFITNTSISTPKSTLTSYCNALLQKNYVAAYDLVSNDVRAMEKEAVFAARTQQFAKAGGGDMTSCTVSNVIDAGSDATGTITFTSTAKRTAVIDFVLSLESGSWKLASEQPRPYGAGPTTPPSNVTAGDND